MTATVKTPSDANFNDLLQQYHEAVINRHANMQSQSNSPFGRFSLKNGLGPFTALDTKLVSC